MIILSLNVRGVRGTLKILSVRMTLTLYRPSILLIQEIMVHGDKAIYFLSPFLPI